MLELSKSTPFLISHVISREPIRMKINLHDNCAKSPLILHIRNPHKILHKEVFSVNSDMSSPFGEKKETQSSIMPHNAVSVRGVSAVKGGYSLAASIGVVNLGTFKFIDTLGIVK